MLFPIVYTIIKAYLILQILIINETTTIAIGVTISEIINFLYNYISVYYEIIILALFSVNKFVSAEISLYICNMNSMKSSY